MEIPDETIAVAARHYAVFAFDDGTPDKIREARILFNDLVADSYQSLTKSALMGGFHRPTAGEFREKFISRCRGWLKSKGML